MSGGQFRHQSASLGLLAYFASASLCFSLIARSDAFQTSFASKRLVHNGCESAASCSRVRGNGITFLRASASPQFDAWLQQNGGRSACTISKDSRRLVAREELKAGAEACSIPSKLFLTQKTAQDALGSKVEELDVETAIALQLIKERSKDSESFWHPWLSLLPDKDAMNVPLFWKDPEFNALEGTTVADDTLDLKEALADEFAQLQQAGWTKIVPNLTLEMYEWAISIVRSRSLSFPKFPGETVLVPAVDTADHIADPSAAAPALQYEGVFREPRVKLSSHAPVRPGSTVRYNYGKCNSALLLQHGLIDLVDVDSGAVDITFSISPMDRFHDDKADILDINKLKEEQTFLLESTAAPPDDLIAFLRLVCVKGTDAFLLESVFRNEVWEFMQLPVSKENEETVLNTLEGYCQASLEAITTTPQEDRSVIASPAAPVRSKMAAAVKLGERNVMINVLRWVAEERQLLDLKEYYQQRRLKILKLDRPIDESEIVDPDVPIRNMPYMS